MLAPRKNLWSTPAEVVEAAIDLLQPTTGDILYDIGAGDCRFLLQCLEVTGAYCVGVEIDVDRAEEGRINIAAAGFTDDRFSIITGNALDQDYSRATAVFLYLVPRGLKLILTILRSIPRKLRVVTYMCPFPGIVSPKRVVKVKTTKHENAEWPLFLYEINSHLP